MTSSQLDPPTKVAEATHDPFVDLRVRGWCLVQDALPSDLRQRLCAELEPAERQRELIRSRNHVEGANDGTLHHLLADDTSFMEVLDALEPLGPLLREFFGGHCVLNSYGGVVNRRDRRAYVHAVHRDIRFAAPERRFMLNILVMLDEFRLDNGATHLLSGSHHRDDKPSDEEFHAQAERALGAAGTLLLFDSRLWHATGVNLVEAPRRALTLTLTSPFFKSQLDYCRLIGADAVRAMSPFRRQLIGWNARIPASLEEYYVPLDDRCYQRGQDDQP